MSYRSTSWKTVKAPIAAKVLWHSEIWPAKPVITVIDRKIVAITTAWVTRKSQTSSACVSTTAKTATSSERSDDAGDDDPPRLPGRRLERRRRWVDPRQRVAGLPCPGGCSARTPARRRGRRTGCAGVRLSCSGCNQVRSSLQRGRNVLNSAMRTPSPRPPASAQGRLDSRPTAAAATATTTRLKKSPAASVLNRGAMSTPARPAKSDESAHAKAETRSAAMPFSSVIRGLSTTARIRRPIAVNRNSARERRPSPRPPRSWRRARCG